MPAGHGRLKRALRRLTIVLVLAASARVAYAHPGSAIAVNQDGRVYFVDTGGGIFSVVRAGRIMRHDGPAFHWFALDSTGRFRATPWPSIPDGELRAVGTNPTLVLSSDVPVAIGNGTFYFPEVAGSGRVQIVAVAPSGARSVRALLPPLRNGVRWLNGLAPGPNGSLYYTEDNMVRVIDSRGRVTTLARVAPVPNCTSIPGIGPELRPHLRGLAVAPDGTVYVAASGCGVLLKINSRGEVAPFLRTASPWAPTAVAVANGEIYVLEYSHTASDDRREWLPRVRKIDRRGVVSILITRSRR